VQQVVSCNGDQNHWNITFLRSLKDWEEECVEPFGFAGNTKAAPIGDG